MLYVNVCVLYTDKYKRTYVRKKMCQCIRVDGETYHNYAKCRVYKI